MNISFNDKYNIFLLPSLLLAKREHPEKWYQEKWCRQQGGEIEVVLPDKTRCDCVTDMRNNLCRSVYVKIVFIITDYGAW